MTAEVKSTQSEGNSTVAEHAKAYRKLRGLPEPAEKELTDLPANWLRYGNVLLSLFWQLNEGRQVGMGFSPLAWPDIKDWADLMGLKLRPVELNLIKAMDIALVVAKIKETQRG